MNATFLPLPPSEQYRLDRTWIHDHYAELLKQHPNQWIAVHRGQVLSAGRYLGEVEDAALAAAPGAEIVSQFIDDGGLFF